MGLPYVPIVPYRCTGMQGTFRIFASAVSMHCNATLMPQCRKRLESPYMMVLMTCKQGVDGNMVETLKRKLEEERQREEEEEVAAAQHDRENEEPVKKKIMVEQVILMQMKTLEI